MYSVSSDRQGRLLNGQGLFYLLDLTVIGEISDKGVLMMREKYEKTGYRINSIV